MNPQLALILACSIRPPIIFRPEVIIVEYLEQIVVFDPIPKE